MEYKEDENGNIITDREAVIVKHGEYPGHTAHWRERLARCNCVSSMNMPIIGLPNSLIGKLATQLKEYSSREEMYEDGWTCKWEHGRLVHICPVCSGLREEL